MSGLALNSMFHSRKPAALAQYNWITDRQSDRQSARRLAAYATKGARHLTVPHKAAHREYPIQKIAQNHSEVDMLILDFGVLNLRYQKIRGHFPLLLCCAFCGALLAQTSSSSKAPPENWPVATEVLREQIRTIGRARLTTEAAMGNSAASAATLSFVPVAPCRLLDTRTDQGFAGAFGPPALRAGQPRTVPAPSSRCGVPAAAAYSLNFAVVPPAGGSVAYLAAWSADQPMPATAVLNGGQGGIVNAPAIVAASPEGRFNVQATEDTDLVIDLNGYFIAQQGAAFRGAWNRTTFYAPGDIVTSSSLSGVTSSYVALTATQGVDPAMDVLVRGGHWAVFAQAGEPGPQGLQGPVGPQGPAGPQGSPGTLVFYGDGSDAALTIASAVDWTQTPPETTLQYSNLTITPSGSLTVPSGLVIRVSGTVNISGSLVVAPTSRAVGSQPLTAGGSCVPAAGFASGKQGNVALNPLAARTLLRTSDIGWGVRTGGGITILAAGGIAVNSGASVSAIGPSGGYWRMAGATADQIFSAGAGGIIVLASKTSITNNGVLVATGGNGANGSSFYSAGGGGGGGIIHLLAPSIAAGSVGVDGGSGGANGLSAASGGFPAPGGACGGNGGASDAKGGPGGAGQVFRTITAEPAALFVP